MTARFLYEDGPQCPGTSSHSFRATSIRVAPCQRLLISCAPRGSNSKRDCSSTWNSWKGPQMPALLRADRSRRRHRIDDCCRAAAAGQGDLPSRCVARPPVCESHAKVWLTALGPRPRDSSITGPERSTSAHSCDLRIGSIGEIYIATRTSPLVAQCRRPKAVALWFVVVFVHAGKAISKVFLKVVHWICKRCRREGAAKTAGTEL